jgi:hypothetical protein
MINTHCSSYFSDLIKKETEKTAQKFIQLKLIDVASRQYILAHDVITVVHPRFNGKLKGDINLPIEEPVVVSRDKAPLFKEWLGE